MFELTVMFFVILAANTYFVYRNAYQAGYVDGVMESKEIQEELQKYTDELTKKVDK